MLSPSQRLVHLHGDREPIVLDFERQDDRRLRVRFACGSTQIDVSPPEGWDGKQPGVQRLSVESACFVNNMKRRDYFNPAGERLATHYLKPGDEQWAAAPQGSDPSRTLKAMPASFGGAPTAVDRV